jgi:RimJ/RimL family protein N-acetyltransferase
MELSNGSLVYLRALEISDLDHILSWHNDSMLYQRLGGSFRWVSRSAEEEWLRRRCAYSTAEINLAICLTASNEHIGNLYVRNIDWVARHAEVHIFIGAQVDRGHGCGGAALRLVLAHLFNDLGLQRVYGHVLASNEPSRRLFKKCGFVEEGLLRRHAFKQGLYEDVVVFGILRADYTAQKD